MVTQRDMLSVMSSSCAPRYMQRLAAGVEKPSCKDATKMQEKAVLNRGKIRDVELRRILFHVRRRTCGILCALADNTA